MTSKFTAGKQRMAGARGEVVNPAAEDRGRIECSSDSRPEGHEAGHDRRPSGSNQRWRHVRSGIVACVVYVAPDKSYLYTDASGTAWPMEMFLARWERT